MPLPTDVECMTGDCGCAAGTCAHDVAYDLMRELEMDARCSPYQRPIYMRCPDEPST